LKVEKYALSYCHMPLPTTNRTETLTREEWSACADAHLKRVEPWTRPYRARRAAGQLHPIYDFLFIYYRNKPSQLEAWHPGMRVRLEEAPLDSNFKQTHYSVCDGLTQLDPGKMGENTRHRLEMALRLCQTVRRRAPAFGCFGMHEWAMVYQGDTEGEVRHRERLPLRLAQADTDAFVRSRPIQCSHFDAFRFFSPGAQRLNRSQPAKDTRLENEQCGCLHTNMDLYKLAAQCMPWVGSEILWQCFEYAVAARQLDMQASPYDCRPLGFEPVRVETSAGKLEYERRQRELSEKAKPLRDELIERLQGVLGSPITLH
jgi:hypothetical protein